jgi:ABC-2 type transport system ATP-binding protein
MLELEGLSRRFGEVVALDGLSFSVGEGQMFGFVGANGAGKTTAMRIVMGVERADAGRVRWQGREIDAGARRRFGYMPEERGLYPKMRIADQLSYLGQLHGMGKAEAGAAAGEWLARFGLSERGRDRVEQLSLGNQQRVQLAAALVHAPELLVLDEPFSGLDPVGVDALSDALLTYTARGVPVIFSSHQLDLVERLCDAVAIIDRGRLVASGTVAELRQGGGDRRYRVDVEGARASWIDGLRGVEVLEKANETVLLRLDPGADDQAILDAARRAGAVRHFGAVQPTLSDLYREVVAR